VLTVPVEIVQEEMETGAKDVILANRAIKQFPQRELELLNRTLLGLGYAYCLPFEGFVIDMVGFDL
jgi:hypothetical protein